VLNPSAFRRNTEARRIAAEQLEAQARKDEAAESAETAGGVQLGGTLLGALIGAIATGGTPQGAALGASIGGGLGTGVAGVVSPDAIGATSAIAGSTSGIAGIDRFLKMLEEDEKKKAGASLLSESK